MGYTLAAPAEVGGFAGCFTGGFTSSFADIPRDCVYLRSSLKGLV